MRYLKLTPRIYAPGLRQGILWASWMRHQAELSAGFNPLEGMLWVWTFSRLLGELREVPYDRVRSEGLREGLREGLPGSARGHRRGDRHTWAPHATADWSREWGGWALCAAVRLWLHLSLVLAQDAHRNEACPATLDTINGQMLKAIECV